MACVVLAAVRRVAGQNVIILAADLAQPDGWTTQVKRTSR